jgi:hypothetical protein
MSYSQSATLFALLAFMWSLMTYYKVDSLEKEQLKVAAQMEVFFNPELSLPEMETH